VGIGGALAEARTEAGLTIAQVSERTRIRETIIRSIELDDYSSCGGDYYARGHIRAIARVVGTDPVPLIEEYDAEHMPEPEPAEPADDLGGHGWRLPSLQRLVGSGPGDPGFDTSTHGGNGQSGHPAVVRDADAGAGVPGGITAAEAFRPRMSVEPSRRLPRLTVALVAIVVVAIGLLSYLLASGGSSPSSPSLTRHNNRTHHPSRSGVAAGHVGSSAPSPAPPTSAPAAVPLTPVNAAAFGPGGPGTGDDAQQASLAIDGNDSTAWRTDWYSTPTFGGLQHGTGLLLDMGKQVTVTSARILLGAAAGGRIQLRAGNTPTLADLRVVAQAHLPGGAVTVSVSSPVTARYLLIWFTRLPPDSSGTYQDSISNVSLSGTTS
jgi:transcriptional regulator with XRE-family HTH domain